MFQGTTVQVSGRRYQVIGDTTKAMVSSASHVNGWHVIRNGACDCDGYKYRGRCSHLEAIAVATRPAKPAAKPLRTLMDLYED